MRAKIEYFDISMAIVNSIILVFAALIIQANMILIIINLISIGVLCGLSIYPFSQHNPYYVISCYILLVFGFIMAVGLLSFLNYTPGFPFYSMISILLSLILILNLCLGASLIKGSASSQAKFARMSGVQVIIEPGITPTAIKDRNMGYPKANLRELEDEIELIQNKHRSRLIALITLISTISFLSTVILSVI
jgi:hypothetical protein